MYLYPGKLQFLIMRHKSIICFALAFCFISCAKTDIPSVSVVGQEEYVMDSSGGEITIPVTSTGISDVTIMLGNNDKWDVDPSNGDRTPKTPWIAVSQIIEHYPQTKSLEYRDSGVVLKIEPNETADKREATVRFISFTQSADIKVIQAGRSK